MAPSEAADALPLDRIIEIIQRIRASLLNIGREQFLADPDKIDATAMRLLVIGETAHKLSPQLKARHAEIAWRNIYAFRNLAAHHYARVDPTRLWEIAEQSLAALEAVCRQELDRAERPA